MPLKLLNTNPDTLKFIRIAREHKVKLKYLFQETTDKKGNFIMSLGNISLCPKSGRNANFNKLKI